MNDELVEVAWWFLVLDADVVREVGDVGVGVEASVCMLCVSEIDIDSLSNCGRITWIREKGFYLYL